MQPSPDGPWWKRSYQVNGVGIGNAYGDAKTLSGLGQHAAKHGMGLIGDVVFKHLAEIEGVSRDDWQKAVHQPDQSVLRELLTKLECFHDFSMHQALLQPGMRDRFISGEPEAVKECMRDFYFPFNVSPKRDAWEKPEFQTAQQSDWTYGIPSIKPNEHTLEKLRSHLAKLRDGGVTGLRVDTVRYLPPAFTQEILDFAKQNNMYLYLEFVSGDLQRNQEWMKTAPVELFPYFYKMMEVFSYNGDLSALANIGMDCANQVIMVENHDTAMGRNNSGHGLSSSIADAIDMRLATQYTLARATGVPLILNKTVEQFPDICASVKFRRLLLDNEARCGVPPVEYIHTENVGDRKNCLLMSRDQGAGIFMMNKSEVVERVRLNGVARPDASYYQIAFNGDMKNPLFDYKRIDTADTFDVPPRSCVHLIAEDVYHGAK